MTSSTNTGSPLERRAAIASLLEDRGDLLVVAGLGSAIWDVEAAQPDHPLNFNILGAMGTIVTTALGLAKAQPDRRVLAVTGDAEILMGFGTIPTVAVHRPDNLAIVVIDNGRYGETGSQLSHTAQGVDIAGIADSSGFPVSRTITEIPELASAREQIHNTPGPVMLVLKVGDAMPAVVMPVRDGAFVKHRFRNTLLGADAAKQ